MIKRALISVSDKTGIVPFAKTLKKHGCEIISTGGTLSKLEESGIKVHDVSVFTKNPEVFGGKVKTLSFQISGALLFDRDKDVEEAKRLDIEAIDLVVCNCYPFEMFRRQGAGMDKLIENVDIGGPTMIRSAAKNFAHVAILTDPKDYLSIMQELDREKGAISYETRRGLMQKAFNYVADYDAMIAMAMDKLGGTSSLRFAFTRGKSLRYGENAHQKALFFKEKDSDDSLYDMNVLNGKKLSYNNLVDISSAIDSVCDLERFACSVIKHNTPCGMSESGNQRRSLELAWNGDSISAFGSVVAFNKEVEEESVEFFHLDDEDKRKRKFVEVLIAPKFSSGALEKLRKHKNLRLIECSLSGKEEKEFRYFKGSLLVQDVDKKLFEGFSCVTQNEMGGLDQELMKFGLKAVKQVKSNAIAIVRRYSDEAFQLIGMGAGQPNRLVSVSLALNKCRENLANEYEGEEEELESYIKSELENALLISEAFFPFPDSVEFCANYGIKTIIQPGGSIRDASVIEACNKRGITMILTGLRHFKH